MLLPRLPSLRRSRRSAPVAVDPAVAWEVVASGAPDAWHTDAAALRFRAAVDRAAGGRGAAWPGPGRPLRAGDRVGFWTVLAAVPPEGGAGEQEPGVLTLRAEVRAPVVVELQVTVAATGVGSRVGVEVRVGVSDPLGAAYTVVDLPAREAVVHQVTSRLLRDVRTHAGAA